MDGVDPVTSQDEETHQVVAAPLERTSAFSRRRTALAVVAWILGLVGVVALGVVGHLPQASTRSATIDPVLAPASVPTAASVRRATALSLPTHHRLLGDDGLVGGIVFGDNIVPPMAQSEVERDGYRRYHIP